MALQEKLEAEGNWLFRYRSWLPLALLVAGLSVFVLTIRYGGAFFHCVQPFFHVYECFCFVVSLSGFAVRVYTVGHTPSGTSGRNVKAQVADCLNTTGAYSVVRHPLYFGNFLMYLGIAMLTCSAGFVLAFVLVFWLYYERIMYAEECFLRRKFGDAWLAWAGVTPAFVPCLRLFRPSLMRFSWRKVVKKEKNGLFALLLVFSLFDAVGYAVGGGHALSILLLGSTAASGLLYVVLTVVKRHTAWLDEAGR